jgi:hypothetical protein
LEQNVRTNQVKGLGICGKMDVYIDYDDNTVEWVHPHSLSAKANAEDNPTWEMAMNGPERAGYWKTMEVEYHTLETEKDSWEVIDREPWMNVLPGTWAFRCKRLTKSSTKH